MGISTPYAMRNQKDLIVATLEFIFESTGEDDDVIQEKELHNILYWGNYGYVMPSLLTTNGDLWEICHCLKNLNNRADKHCRDSQFTERMHWIFNIRTPDGFKGYDPVETPIEKVFADLKGVKIETLA